MTRDNQASAAIDVVTDFLLSMEERDLDAASRYLAPNANIVVPGGRHFGDLEALVEAARKRYRKVAKNIELVESICNGDESVVYVIGQLFGVDTSGAAFEDVRFIDRVVVRDGLITDHRVWNDLAETSRDSAVELSC